MSINTFRRRAATDWPANISALQAAGFSYRDIAHALTIGHAIVRAWKVTRPGQKRPSIPNYEDGRALFDFAAHVGVVLPSNPTVALAAGQPQSIELHRS